MRTELIPSHWRDHGFSLALKNPASAPDSGEVVRRGLEGSFMKGMQSVSTSAITEVKPGIPPVLDTDVTEAVTTALKQKGNGPFIGIPCGMKTVLIRRTVFKLSLAGLRIVTAEYVPMEGQPGAAIRVYATGEHVKATRLFLHQNPREYRNQVILKEWKAQQIKKIASPKLNKYQKQISKLERQLRKLGPLHRPHNPAIVSDKGTVAESIRQDWHLWKLQKPTRRAIMRLARIAPQTMSTAQLYKELAGLLKAIPVYETANTAELLEWINGDHEGKRPKERYTLTTAERIPTKWGELTASDRERAKLGDFWDYLKRLWEFCGLESKPYRSKVDWDLDEEKRYFERHWGRERYYTWQAAKNERRQLEYMIADLKRQESEQK